MAEADTQYKLNRSVRGIEAGTRARWRRRVGHVPGSGCDQYIWDVEIFTAPAI
jgi:hypothetical protein